MTIATRRKTRYTDALRNVLVMFGHATNAQLADELRRDFPSLSDTTVHRITQRMIEDGEIQYAPNAADGSKLFDSNVSEHDHFECAGCGELRDITISDAGRESIRQSIGDCRVDGSLKIVGTCCNCMTSN